MEDLDKLVKQNVDVYGRAVLAQMISILQQNGKYASGNLVKSLRYNVLQDAQGIEIVFSGADHAAYVDKGRKPGKYPPKGALLQWMSLKGIPAKAEFPIRRSIFRFGIEPVPFINQSLSDNKDLLIAAIDKSVRVAVDSALRR